MKKFIVFAAGFTIIFSLLFLTAEFLSGMILTAMYVPDLRGAWEASAGLPQEVALAGTGNSFFLTLFIALLAAAAAYAAAQKFPRSSEG